MNTLEAIFFAKFKFERTLKIIAFKGFILVSPSMNKPEEIYNSSITKCKCISTYTKNMYCCALQTYRLNFEAAKIGKKACEDVTKATGLCFVCNHLTCLLNNSKKENFSY